MANIRITNKFDENGLVTAVKRGTSDITDQGQILDTTGDGGKGAFKFNTSMIAFPRNVDSYPTWVKYEILEYLPIGSKAGTSRSKSSHMSINVAKVFKGIIGLSEENQFEITEDQSWKQEAAGGMIDQTVKNVTGNLADGNFKGALGAVGDGASKIPGTLQDLGSKAGASISGALTGVAVVDKMALKYDGPGGPRSFSMTHTFVPRSAEESKAARDIIKLFRTSSSPALHRGATEGSGSAYTSYDFPDLFRVTRMAGSNANPHYPLYDLCYCKSVNVKYGDERGTTYEEDSSPISYTITLSFEEISIQNRKLIEEGY